MPNPFSPWATIWNNVFAPVKYQALLTAKQKFGLGNQKSVLDSMSQEDIDRLTPEAKKILGSVPIVTDAVSSGSAANYRSIGLPKWMTKGFVVTNPVQTTQQGNTIRVSPKFMESQVSHEAIHALENNMGIKLDPELFNKLSPAVKTELTRRYFSPPDANLAPSEALATAGTYGWENVPDEMKPLLSKVFIQNNKPAQADPTGESVRELDKWQKTQQAERNFAAHRVGKPR